MTQTNNKSGITQKIFRKLQLRFTFIVSIVCSILVAVSFVAVYLINYISSEQTINDSLNASIALVKNSNNPLTAEYRSKIAQESECMVCFCTGDLPAFYLRFDYLTEETSNTVIRHALAGETDFCVANGYYRVLSATMKIQSIDFGIYAIYDYTSTRVSLRLLMIVLIVLFVILSGVLFGLAYILSGKVLSPAKDSLVKQKELVANASHELKTPITIINANLDVLQSNGDTTVAQNEKWLSNIQLQTERMHELVTEMLELSSFESAEYHPIYKQVNLSYLTESAVLSFDAACFDKKITTDTDFESDIVAYADEKGWRKLIGILYENAIKYSPEGGKISVALMRKKKAVNFSITNQGEISAQDFPRIFERFYKSSDKSDSFGLGLAMAKTITQNMKGEITCTSADGLTTFSVVVPI